VSAVLFYAQEWALERGDYLFPSRKGGHIHQAARRPDHQTGCSASPPSAERPCPSIPPRICHQLPQLRGSPRCPPGADGTPGHQHHTYLPAPLRWRCEARGVKGAILVDLPGQSESWILCPCTRISPVRGHLKPKATAREAGRHGKRATGLSGTYSSKKSVPPSDALSHPRGLSHCWGVPTEYLPSALQESSFRAQCLSDAQCHVHLLQQHGWTEGLGDVVVRPGFQGFPTVRLLGQSSEHNDLDVNSISGFLQHPA